MRYQPQGLQRVNRNSPLSRGLTFAKSVPGAAAPAMLGKSAPSGALSVEIKAVGKTTRFAGYGTPVIDTNAGQTSKGTVLVLHQSTVLPPNGGFPNPGYSHVLAATSSGGTSASGWLLMLNNGTGYLGFRAFDAADNGNAVASADGTIALNDGIAHVTVATWDFGAGGIQQTYVDGRLHATSGAIAAAISSAQPMRLGRSRESNNFWGVFDGNIALSMVWDRVLLPAEVRAVSANPWQLFEAPDEDDFLVAASGPTYTLGASSGAYALTGAAATVFARRRLAAAAAGFALTPLAAALKASRKLAAASGPLGMTASSARLVAARRLPAEPGAWALSASMGRLTAARKLTAAPAAFALTGGAATFVYTSAPGGQGPTYTLTGGSGAFLLTAGTARLLLVRRLVAAAGAFSAAGSPVALVATRRLGAAAGSMAIVAAPAGLRATRRLPGAAASFSLTGSTATFFYSPIDRPGGPTYTLTAVGGMLGLTGTGVGMHARRRLSGVAGQFALTGSTAKLVYSQQIVYARAPAGSGYAPQQIETQTRPGSASTARPSNTQRNCR